jgi:elongation factor P
MKISANDIKLGFIIVFENDLWSVVKPPEHTKPGKGGAYVQVEMKNLRHGTKMNHRFSSVETVEKAYLEQKDMQFLYMEGDNLVMMDQENFEQIELNKKILDDKLPFVAEGMKLVVEFYQDQALSVRLPATVVVTIEQTEPHIKGSTATSSYKPAILENGVRVMVPPYISSGEQIVVKTEDFTFVERAK